MDRLYLLFGNVYLYDYVGVLMDAALNPITGIKTFIPIYFLLPLKLIKIKIKRNVKSLPISTPCPTLSGKSKSLFLFVVKENQGNNEK